MYSPAIANLCEKGAAGRLSSPGLTAAAFPTRGAVAVRRGLNFPLEFSRRLLVAGLFAFALSAQTATDVKNEDIMAIVKKTASQAVNDTQLRVVGIYNEYNVGVGVVHRARTQGAQTPNGIEHSQITEVYHVISGEATLVTGGTIENAKDSAPDSQVVKVLNGPSRTGGAIRNGVSRKVGAGDVIVIPPNTAHWFSEISSDQIVYLVIRMDPHKVLPAGYTAK